MTLTQLHDGIDIPEYATRVPWLITRSELFGYVPAEAFTTSADRWPRLRFTLLGVTATFTFDFVSHPESRLLEVGFKDPDVADFDEAFRTTAAALRDRLGDPNAVNLPDCYHLMWRDDRVWVNHSASVPEQPTRRRTHSLSVRYHAGVPRAWVGPGERTLAQVKQLLNLMPGVEVTVVWCSPTDTRLGLAVRSLPSLARLARTMRDVNVQFQVGVDEYREANGGLSLDDPTGIQYLIQIPGPREPEPGGSRTTLQILGSYLARDLWEQGLLAEAEAHRLMMDFNDDGDS